MDSRLAPRIVGAALVVLALAITPGWPLLARGLTAWLIGRAGRALLTSATP